MQGVPADGSRTYPGLFFTWKRLTGKGMGVHMDIQLFDNFEDDGQLSMFDMGEDIENLQTLAVEEAPAQEELPASGSAGIRIQKCSSCGKLLSVKEEDGCYVSSCNACGVKYLQKM